MVVVECCVFSAYLLALRLHLALGTHSETNHLLAWDIVIERLFFQPASLCVCVCVCHMNSLQTLTQVAVIAASCCVGPGCCWWW